MTPPASMDAGPLRRRLRDEDGSIINAPATLAMFLTFLLIAVQISVHLYAVSTTTAIMFDVTRKVAAGAESGSYTCNHALSEIDARLGAWADALDRTCVGDQPLQDTIVLTLDGPSPARLIGGFGEATGFATFEREVRVHTERSP